MIIKITSDEITMMLGAILAFTGRPFHKFSKRVLSGNDVAILDALRAKLRCERDHSPSPLHSIDVSDGERSLIWECLQACDAEFGDDPVEIRLHLWAGTRETLVGLIGKIGPTVSA